MLPFLDGHPVLALDEKHRKLAHLYLWPVVADEPPMPKKPFFGSAVSDIVGSPLLMDKYRQPLK